MYVRTSKKMAQELQKALPQYQIEQVKMDYAHYVWSVSASFLDAERDQDPKDGKYSAIKVEYPYNFYACPTYLTTRALVECFNESDKTMAGFIDCVAEYIEI